MTSTPTFTISFHGLPASQTITEEARSRTEDLQRQCPRLQRVDVLLQADERHHRTGRRYDVRLHAHIPGHTFEVTRHPPQPEHGDAHVALHDAFKALRRQIHDYTEKRRDARR